MFACGGEETSTLAVTVRVEPTTRVSTAFPAQVLVGFDSSGSGFVVFRVAFVCDPLAAPFVTTAQFSTPTGNDPAIVDAWIVPLGSAAPPACGPLPAPEPVPLPGPSSAGVQGTSAHVVILAGCGAGELRSATLVIASP